MTRLTLPLPPCVNTLWKGDRRGRRWLDPKAAAFKDTVGKLAMMQRVKPLAGDVEVHIEFYVAGLERDIDASIKVCLDALNGFAWTDDKQVTRMSVEIHRKAPEDRCEVIFGAYREDPLGVGGEPHFTEFRKKVEQVLRRPA